MGASLVLPSLLCAHLLAEAGGSGPLRVPSWDWEPARGNIQEACLHVPDTHGQLYNNSVVWRNNSRLLFLAVPEGEPPAGGWPVLVDLLTVNYPPGRYSGSTQHCGLDGRDSPTVDHPPTPAACAGLVRAACSATAALGWGPCHKCVERVSTNVSRGLGPAPVPLACHGSTNATEMVAAICPPPPPLSGQCAQLLRHSCPYSAFNASSTDPSRQGFFECRNCVYRAARNVTAANRAAKTSCLFWENTTRKAHQAHAPLPSQEASDYCRPIQPKAGGRGQHNDLPGNVRSFKPFDSPLSLGMQCSCINSSNFTCGRPFDDGAHGVGGFVPTDGSCDDDVFFGGIWHQRLKQYCLQNGIAVLEANNYVRDGWDSWESLWEGGYDQPFFSALAGLLGKKQPPPPPLPPPPQPPQQPGKLFEKLNPKLLAFRGWSGGAHMVSFLIDRAARGQLPGLGIAAGVMMAGGSHACYNMPPLAKGWCSACNPHSKLRNKSGGVVPVPTDKSDPAFEWWHSSAAVVAAGDIPSCMYCCPNDYTEDWYAEHPEAYASHPFTLLAQTQVDNEADSAAALNYHTTMLKHGAASRSELHYLPVAEQRCGCLGEVGGVGVPTGDSFARFCKVDNQTCLNHTQGFPSLVEPATKFLQRAFAHHASMADHTKAGAS